MNGRSVLGAPAAIPSSAVFTAAIAAPHRMWAKSMKHSVLVVLSAALIVGAADAGSVAAGEFGTKEEAQTLVEKAVALIKEQGPEKAYPEFTDRAGKFVDRDLYIVVYGLDGKILAHGGNAKLVGKEALDAQDADGKFFVRERVDLARKQDSFWQDYKFANPTNQKVEPKQTYCERLNETAVCAGVYKF